VVLMPLKWGPCVWTGRFYIINIPTINYGNKKIII
jgi:hypothetical protein